jgi:hypothetical protein
MTEIKIKTDTAKVMIKQLREAMEAASNGDTASALGNMYAARWTLEALVSDAEVAAEEKPEK